MAIPIDYSAWTETMNPTDGNVTQNFWRSQENLSVIPVGGLTNGILDWAVSQGASLIPKIEAGVAACTSSPDVRAAMAALGRAMGGG